jgi:hypothetical protein
MLIKRDASPVQVIDGLDHLMGSWLGGVSIRWSRQDDWSSVQNYYLQAVETVEAQLAAMFDDDDGVAAGLFGEHYKMIRDMSDATPRPAPLVNDEAQRQVRALERLKAKVQAVLALKDREGDLVILDTNVLMHYQRLDTVPWAEVLGAGQVRLILPAIVIDELDNKKYTGSDTMAARAAKAIRVLRNYSGKLGSGNAATFADGTTLEVFLDDPGHQRKANPDEEMLTRGTLLQRVIGRPVRIVTGDLGMQLRAGARGLGHVEMPDKYAKDAQRRPGSDTADT